MLTEAWRDCHNQRVLTYYTNRIFIQIMRLFMHSLHPVAEFSACRLFVGLGFALA